jgi:signal peptidase I
MPVLAADGGTAVAWLRLSAVAASRALLGVTAALLLWATAPLALGWQPVVVTSGSMAPAVAVGDVVVAAPVDPADLRPGHVVVVEDPARPWGLLTHRVQQVGADGTVTTKGDANPTSDTSPIAADAVRGLARLRIPFVGLPLAWATGGHVAALVTFAAAAALAVAVAACEPLRSSPTPRAMPPAPRARVRRRGVLARIRKRLLVRPHGRGPAAALVVLGAVCATSAAVAEPARAAFSGATTAAGSWTAAADWVAPTTSAAVVSAMSGTRPHHATGFVRQGGNFRVYANASDTGNPASGVASVTSGLINVTGSGTPAPLTSGPVTVGGTVYGYGSATLTAAGSLGEGSRTFSVMPTDGAGNAGSSTWNVTVDNTTPSATDVQALNKTGGTVGQPEAGDQLVLTYSEPVEPVSTFPTSLSPTFTGTPAQVPVIVRIIRTGNGGSAVNTLTVHDAADTTELSLGQVRLGSASYHTNSSTPLTYSGSTMAVGSGSPGTVVLTLGTPNASPGTVNSSVTLQWTVGTAVTDRAGNAVAASTVNEGGSSDADF